MPHPNLCFLFFMEPSSTCDLLDIFKFCFTSNTFSEHTQFEQKHGKRKTDGRSATDGTASQLFSASSSLSFGTYSPKIRTFTLEKYELNLFFKFFLPLAPLTHQVYSPLLTDCMIALHRWARAAHLYFHNGCKKPGKCFWTTIMFRENQYCCKLSFKPYGKTEYTSSYGLKTQPSK